MESPARAWPWLAGGGGVLAAAALLIFAFFRRKSNAATNGAQVPGQTFDSTEPKTVPAASDATADAATFAPPPPEPGDLPGPAFGLAGLDVRLEARHLSRALVNATLAYRLTLTNRAHTALGPLRVAGDIISAHGSLSAREQLALDSDTLEVIHEVPALQAGETISVSGELRLPIASILPMHSGQARVFVPLARFRFEAAGETGEGMSAIRVFVVGRAGERADGALRPFAFDRGPGVVRALSQREVRLPA